MDAINQNTTSLSDESISNWFDKFITNISADRLMMETDTAPKEVKQFYQDAMLNDYNAISKTIRDVSTKFFIANIVDYYFTELRSFKANLQALAFDFSNAKILVWAQIADDDENSEDALILSEARANNKFSENGFFISSTIVEEGDHLSIPPHYKKVNINGRLSSPYQAS